MTQTRRGRKDSGFALLLVLLMAAIIAITMYIEIPRVAFDSQRQKEQLLVERGEQYKVAIRRFMAQTKRWPKDLDELESFNNRHYLRHRYKDPMTGKDEWRIIHIQNGVLTDSINSKQKADLAKSTPNGFIQEMATMGSTGNQGATRTNPGLRRRPSDDASSTPGGTGGAPDPANPGVVPPPVNVNPYPGQPGQVGQPVQQGQMGQPVVGQPMVGGLPPGVPNMPGMQNPNAGAQASGGFISSQPTLGSVGTSGVTTGVNGQPVYPGQQPGQYPGAPGMPVNSQTGGVSPYPINAGANGLPPGLQQPGANINQNSATQLINGILTSPRPGGLAGIQGGQGFVPQPVGPGGPQSLPAGGAFNGPPQPDSNFGGGNNLGGGGQGGGLGGGIGSRPGTGQTIGGGVAGVASTADGDSIMSYDDHTNYSEWEFIFDPTKWHAPPNPNGGSIGNQIGSQIGTPVGPPGGAAGIGGMGVGGPGGGGIGGMGGSNQQRTQGGATQQGTGGGAFGGGGLVNIRPGRK